MVIFIYAVLEARPPGASRPNFYGLSLVNFDLGLDSCIDNFWHYPETLAK